LKYSIYCCIHLKQIIHIQILIIMSMRNDLPTPYEMQLIVSSLLSIFAFLAILIKIACVYSEHCIDVSPVWLEPPLAKTSTKASIHKHTLQKNGSKYKID
jgi:hypothetical protein